MAALEFGGTVPAGSTQIEWLTTLPPPDGTIPVVPLEWQGTTSGSLSANSAADFEWLARQTGDAALSGEAVARALGDALGLLENLSAGSVAVGGDSPAPLEVTAPIRTDAGLPTAWALAVSLVADTALPLEVAGATASPAPAIPQVSGRRLRLFRV